MNWTSFLYGAGAAVIGVLAALWFVSWLAAWIVDVGDRTHEDR